MHTFFEKKYQFFIIFLAVIFSVGLVLNITIIKKHYQNIENSTKQFYAKIIKSKFETLSKDISSQNLLTEKDSILYFKRVFELIDSNISNSFIDTTFLQPISYFVTNLQGNVIHQYNFTDNKELNIYSEEFYLSNKKYLTLHIVRHLTKRQKLILNFIVIWISIFIMTLLLIFILTQRHNRIQKVKSDILNNLSHEFKTPLTSIQLISEMLIQNYDYITPDKLNQYGFIIHQEANRMLSNVKRLLETSHIEDKKFPLQMRQYNVHGLLHYIINNYQNIGDKKITIITHLNATDYIVSVDRKHFNNAVTNIIENSIKYSSANKTDIIITTSNTKKSLFIEIRDNGIGIHKQDLKYIFNKFYRVSTGNLQKTSGYGLGLYYVKKILLQMKAKISVQSEINIGTVFVIEIKL
jgi:two-component system phosphate regulon sensor histidine kinase PhoR